MTDEEFEEFSYVLLFALVLLYLVIWGRTMSAPSPGGKTVALQTATFAILLLRLLRRPQNRGQ
jgi:hypothetical protein